MTNDRLTPCEHCGHTILDHGSGEGFPCPEGEGFSLYSRYLAAKVAKIGGEDD